jgi:hypothetical protein
MVERRKTTLYLEADLLRATKVAAAREDKPEYQVVEEALRKHLGLDLMQRVWARSGLDENEAMRLAVAEVRAHRRSRRRQATTPPSPSAPKKRA